MEAIAIVRLNLRLIAVRLSVFFINLSPSKTFAVKFLSVPLAIVTMLRGVSHWGKIIRFSRLIKRTSHYLSVPAFFWAQSENIIWGILLYETDWAIKKHVEFENLEALRSAVDSGRGAIILGAHYGPSIFARLLKEKDIDTKVLVSARTDRSFKNSSRLGLPFLKTGMLDFVSDDSRLFQSGKSEKQLVRYVKSGGAVFMMIDFPAYSIGGGTVDFLGEPFRFNTFAFKLARNHGVPVFFAFLVREGRDRLRLSMQPCGAYETPEEGLKMYAAALEPVIMHDPFNWANLRKFCRWLDQAHCLAPSPE